MNPFDSIRFGLILAIIVETIILLGWMFSQGRLPKRYLLVGPILVGLFVGLDYAVETNREQLERRTRHVVQAVADENPGAVIAMLSDEFQLDNGMDRQKVAAEIERRLSRPIVEKNHITRLQITRSDDEQGIVEFVVLTTLDPQNPAAVVSVVKSTWQFDFAKTDGQYQLTNIINLKFNNGPPIDIFKYQPRY